MTPADTVAISLVTLIGVVLAGGILFVLLAVRLHKLERRHAEQSPHPPAPEELPWMELSLPAPQPIATPNTPRPISWLAIKNRDPHAVQAALALTNPRSCSWSTLRNIATEAGLENRTTERQLFIAPPVNGWILVMGNGLPCPNDDVDICFRFLLALSRKLGPVQFFQADRILHHHAWVRAEAGRIIRAYAWAEKTLWHQGAKTSEESALGMKCFTYVETVSRTTWGAGELIATNVDKVPLLAARWSLNPAAIDVRFWEQRRGIAGRLGRNLTSPH